MTKIDWNAVKLSPGAKPIRTFSRLYIDGCRLNAAIVALRKARKVIDCWSAPMPIFGCPTTGTDAYDVDDPDWKMGDQHKLMASALLDGFSIEEVTLAGG